MLANENISFHAQRNRVLQMRSDGEDLGSARALACCIRRLAGCRGGGRRFYVVEISRSLGKRGILSAGRRGAGRNTRGRVRSPEGNRERRVTPGAAEHHLTAGHDPHDRIIDMPNDGAIVHEKKICNPPQTFERFTFFDADWFVAQISTRRHDREIQFAEKQMVERRIGKHDTEVGIGGETANCQLPTANCRRRTMGASGELSRRSSRSEISQSWRMLSSEGNMTANGFSSRCFRSRRRRTASSLRASTSNWKPPIPLTAKIFPFRICLAASPSAASARARFSPNEFQNCNCGPQRGQAIGSAWKRRSLGSRYSRAHSSHITNFFIEVLARS